MKLLLLIGYYIVMVAKRLDTDLQVTCGLGALNDIICRYSQGVNANIISVNYNYTELVAFITLHFVSVI